MKRKHIRVLIAVDCLVKITLFFAQNVVGYTLVCVIILVKHNQNIKIKRACKYSLRPLH